MIVLEQGLTKDPVCTAKRPCLSWSPPLPGDEDLSFYQDVEALFNSLTGRAQRGDASHYFCANGSVLPTGDGVIDGGLFSGGKGVAATNGVTALCAPSGTPVRSDPHPGPTTWWRR
ncbi:hypothetical protein [Burkholderia ubonensis]|uniref:hypothetical protein n=1 Tax=Burkholderia ubonensis TaxID=101571 RepID=UPI000B024F9F|nr:hypothetical protein [Burkholderia ubonensis]